MTLTRLCIHAHAQSFTRTHLHPHTHMHTRTPTPTPPTQTPSRTYPHGRTRCWSWLALAFWRRSGLCSASLSPAPPLAPQSRSMRLLARAPSQTSLYVGPEAHRPLGTPWCGCTTRAAGCSTPPCALCEAPPLPSPLAPAWLLTSTPPLGTASVLVILALCALGNVEGMAGGCAPSLPLSRRDCSGLFRTHSSQPPS